MRYSLLTLLLLMQFSFALSPECQVRFKEIVKDISLGLNQKGLDLSKIQIKGDNVNFETIVKRNLELKSKNIKWGGQFEIKDGHPYPSLNHVLRGNIISGPTGPILKSGMHTPHSLQKLIIKNKSYSKEMLTDRGTIRSKYYKEFPNGVREVLIPQLDEAGEVIKGSKGVKTYTKNLFPRDWSKEKILKASEEIKNNYSPITYVKSNKNGLFVFEGKFEDVNMRVVVDFKGNLITTYPHKNLDGVRVESPILLNAPQVKK